jgi:hypothetical protein
MVITAHRQSPALVFFCCMQTATAALNGAGDANSKRPFALRHDKAVGRRAAEREAAT